jgi:hypothetical protein
MTKTILLTILSLLIACCIGMSCLSSAAALFIVRQNQQTSPSTPTLTPAPLPELPQSPEDSSIPSDISRQMYQIEQQVVVIRSLFPEVALKRNLLTPDQLRQKVSTEFFTEYTRQEVDDDVLELSVLGFVKPDFDLYQLYIDLFSENIAGYYDTEVRQMFLVQGAGFSGIQRMTYAHEYTHTLQDQTYNLRQDMNFTDEYCETNSEYCSAVKALLEGDASLTEQNWLFSYASDQDRKDIQQFASNYRTPVYDSAPEYLKADFLFPYRQGLEFAQTLYDLDGYEAIDNAFHSPPVSTEQILHPEKYPADLPSVVQLPDFISILGTGWRETDRNMLGEWYTYLMLAKGWDTNIQLSDSEARTASAGWGGDQLVFYIHDSSRQSVMVYRSTWDTAADANEFWKAMQGYCSKRWDSPSIIGDDYQEWFQTSNGAVRISFTNNEILWVIAPDLATIQKIIQTMPGVTPLLEGG